MHGAVSEPLASLGRWPRRSDICLKLQLPALLVAPSLLPPAFAQLPEAARQRVTHVWAGPRRPALSAFVSAYLDDPDDPDIPVSGAAVGALAAFLPCLRQLDISNLPSTWTPGGAGEAYAALATLGTVEDLRLPGIPALTGVEALVGSLRLLAVGNTLPANGDDDPGHSLDLPAASSLGQLTRLEGLKLNVPHVDLGEGSQLSALLGLVAPSLNKLMLELRLPGAEGERRRTLAVTFKLAGRRLLSAELGCIRLQEMAVIARDELLPCLELGGRLQRLSVAYITVEGGATTDFDPLLDFLRRCDLSSLGTLEVQPQASRPDVCCALSLFAAVETIRLRCRAMAVSWGLQPQSSGLAGSCLLELPPPEEVLRMALQKIEVAADAAQAGGRVLVLRGPSAAAAPEEPSSDAITAWAQNLERRALAAAGPALPAGTVLIQYARPLPPASAVLLECGKVAGAAEAVAAAVAAAADGSRAARGLVLTDGRYQGMAVLEWGLNKVMGELWEASCGAEGGLDLQQRVGWAMGVTDLVNALPRKVNPRLSGLLASLAQAFA